MRGGGNFGVATRFRYQLNPVETVLGGAIVYPATSEELRAYADATAAAPEELTTITFVQNASPLPFIPPDTHGTPVHVIMPCHAGNHDAWQQALAPCGAWRATPRSRTRRAQYRIRPCTT
jgi:CubicO group peptidase (beta-lactamase class C family)